MSEYRVTRRTMLARFIVTLAMPGLLAAAPPSGAAPATVKPIPIDAAGLKKQIAARKGKVVVVNFWATWCAPCVAEFPDFIKLQQTHGAKGVEVLTVSFDEPKDVPTRVTPFLTKNRVTRGAFVNKTGSEPPEPYLQFLEPKLPEDAAVSLPRTYVFDRSGKLVLATDRPQTYASLQKIVAPLLAKK